MTKVTTKHIGGGFDDFLKSEGVLAETQAEAMKRVLSWQIQEFLQQKGIKKSDFAQQMQTSRSQLDRLLDPCNTSLNLKTLSHAVGAMGKHIEFRIV